MTVIHANVFDPTQSLFKQKASTRAKCQTINCTNSECPLLARGQCYMRGGLFGNRCPYGSARTESGPTKRAAGFYKWICEKRDEHKGVPHLEAPPDKMEFIGEFVLLPYDHMTRCESVPFRSRASLFTNGDPFLDRKFWTIETVLALLSNRPQAIMGGEITAYQKEQIPLFLTHLREADPDMWKQLIAVRPQYDVAANHVGRKAILQTLNHPIEWTNTGRNGVYPVRWQWDGKSLTTDSIHAYHRTWGGLDAESVTIHLKPKARAVVVVQSNEWVNQSTEFVT